MRCDGIKWDCNLVIFSSAGNGCENFGNCWNWVGFARRENIIFRNGVVKLPTPPLNFSSLTSKISLKSDYIMRGNIEKFCNFFPFTHFVYVNEKMAPVERRFSSGMDKTIRKYVKWGPHRNVAELAMRLLITSHGMYICYRCKTLAENIILQLNFTSMCRLICNFLLYPCAQWWVGRSWTSSVEQSFNWTNSQFWDELVHNFEMNNSQFWNEQFTILKWTSSFVHSMNYGGLNSRTAMNWWADKIRKIHLQVGR